MDFEEMFLLRNHLLTLKNNHITVTSYNAAFRGHWVTSRKNDQSQFLDQAD